MTDIATSTPIYEPTTVCTGAGHHYFPEDGVTCECGAEANLAHQWIVAAEVRVSEKVAKHADLRGSFRTADGQRVDALEVYCRGCRRPYDDVADDACEAKIDNSHLIGGDPGVRKKRKVYAPEGEVIAGPSINRMGTAAYVSGDAAPVG